MLHVAPLATDVDEIAEEVLTACAGPLEWAVLAGDAEVLEATHQLLWETTRRVGALRLHLMVLADGGASELQDWTIQLVADLQVVQDLLAETQAFWTERGVT